MKPIQILGSAVDFVSCCSNFGEFPHSEVNPNFGDQLSILSAIAPFFGDLFCSFSNSEHCPTGCFNMKLVKRYYSVTEIRFINTVETLCMV